MDSYEFRPGRAHLFRLPPDSDIVTEITGFAAERGIDAAWVSYLGAVRRAAFRFFDQDALEYRDLVVDRPLEVLSGVGNISLLDGEPFLHTHAVFGDDDGNALGGHLNVGCRVFSLEVRLDELDGEAPVRQFDEGTGLAVWA